MNLQDQLSLQREFEAAVSRVDNMPGDQAAAHMTDLYGLYKQATEGDHDTLDPHNVGDDTPDDPSGKPGMSQAQWDAWSKFKGVSQDDARRQYIQKVQEVAGPVGEKATIITGNGQPATGSQVGGADAASGPEVQANDNTTLAQQPTTQPGVSQGGLRGDITAGAPYGGEDKLKGDQS
ncbi:acyl-CoA-binding protein [Hymenobacter sp. 5516J-16]|uniref:Acyl-CoA-binding protein n=1 Tax=Hymenobacter sublimis TaxID=2933777 RepID=A0ABY4JAI5_9BACT|nr:MULTISPECIES: acyl-CoA-binding protein [Hymenobacter]UOQ76154.1 acyl-CoA-binding protein [Hymenobacter sp. 5516J-16]UPL49823.1 acyl-CoA-binding protein [Hymenobacter sublimis]